MLSQITPRLTVCVSVTGDACSSYKSSHRPSSIFPFLHAFRSSPSIWLCFFSYSQGLLFSLAYYLVLPCQSLFFRSLVLQVTLWGADALQYGRDKHFPLKKSHDSRSRIVFCILYTMLPDGPLLLPPPSFHKTTYTAGPIWRFRVHEMLSHILHYFSRGVNIVTPSALQGDSKR